MTGNFCQIFGTRDKGNILAQVDSPVLFLQYTPIGLIAAGVLTLCIAYLWILPYIQTCKAAFYESLKEEQPQPVVE